MGQSKATDIHLKPESSGSSQQGGQPPLGGRGNDEGGEMTGGSVAWWSVMDYWILMLSPNHFRLSGDV